MSEINLKNEEVSVSPNPFKDQISIKGVPSDFSYSINNIVGQVLLKGEASGNVISNLGNLPSGTYFILIKTKEKVSIQKLIK